ncbi:MAG: class I SAM-dependent methyltransferase [Chloroflexota bacterium]
MTTNKCVPKVRGQDGCVIYYSHAASADYWDNHWERTINKEMFRYAAQGIIGWKARDELISRYMPKDEIILEAGCGLGQIVLALRQRGYHAIGIDFAEQTLRQVKSLYPGLPLHISDLTQLDIADNTCGGYLSFGVIEHREEGPQPFLNEAYRVLKPGRVAIISVPQVNLLRRAKVRLGLYPSRQAGGQFYQYAFTRLLLRQYVEGAGFEVLDWRGYDTLKGIKDEVGIISVLNRRYPGFFRRVSGRLGMYDWIESTFGHMMIISCRKPLSP